MYAILETLGDEGLGNPFTRNNFAVNYQTTQAKDRLQGLGLGVVIFKSHGVLPNIRENE